MSSVEDRLRRPADVQAIRTLDAVCCRLLGDGDWPALVQLLTPGGVFDGRTTLPPAAAGRCADDLVRTRAGWRHRVERVPSSYGAPLTDGRDAGRYELAGAVPPEARA